MINQIICRKTVLKGIDLALVSKRSQSQWHLVSSVCLQRRPRIVPEMNWLEKKMSETLSAVETNHSLYCDHEMRHFEDIRRAKRIASGEKVDEKDLDAAAKQTAQDFEEFYNDLFKKFQKAPRITQADVTNDKQSLNRNLDKHLMLVCRQKLGDKFHWLLPQAINVGGESMVESAKRALKLFSAADLEVKFLGNAPSAVYSYTYPEEVTKVTQKKGAKVFFFKAYHINGDFEPNQEYCDNYQWLDRKELSVVLPNRYWSCIRSSLLIEDLDINEIMARNKKFNKIVKKRFSVG